MTNIGTNIIKCENLSKEYNQAGRTIRILSDLNFSINSGEQVAIVGRSGSGKTTLLQLLAGLDSPTHGKVIFNGQDWATMGSKDIDITRNQQLGFIFQQYYLLPEFTALENVMMPLRIAGYGYTLKIY